MNIRHSSLPKLALCGQFESAPGESSPAAARGTRLDAVFRNAWQTGELPNDLPTDEAELVRWTINQLLKIGENRHPVETEERACKVKTPGIEHVGTADAVCVGGRWLADLKTGQLYNYREQMAAYSLGLMHEHMCDSWTAYVLFADQRKTTAYSFTYAEASAIIESTLANVGTPPKINDYCGWCKHSLTCVARESACVEALARPAAWFPELLADPVRLGEFLTKCRTFDDFRDAAEAEARRLLESGTEVPGWRLQKPRVTEFVDAEVLVEAASQGRVSPIDVIRAHGSLSATKARKLWPDVPVARKEAKPALVSK